MARYLLCVVMLVVVVVVVSARRPHHPKFPHKFEHDFRQPSKGEYTKVACTGDRGMERDKIIAESRCGAPRDVFVTLDSKGSHEEVSPGAVWVKRCVGLCEFDNGGSCVPTAIVKREIPVRIYNADTNKEMCATYTIDEHVSCGCCSKAAGDCAAPKVYVPRKCACQCPNTQERRLCLRQTTMRWNRSKCICEERPRIRT